MEDRIIELETKIAYQDNTIEVLNEVVTKQQDQIDQLTRQITEIKEQISGLADSLLSQPGEEPPPPHY